MQPIVNHNLIILARETRSINQYDLAEMINLSPAHLSKMEQGVVEVYEEYIEKFAKALQYPKSFFYQEAEILQPILSYRKRQIVAQKLLTFIEAKMNVMTINISAMNTDLGITPKALPCFNIENFGTPYECAKAFRKYLKIKEPVIENITKIIEGLGIIIASFNFGTDRVDSRTVFTPNGQAIIFVNKTLLGDRLRFSLAYELAHLVMHQCASPSLDRDVANEANKFAAELLMPDMAIKKDMNEPVTLALLGKLKIKYKVSMQALVYRADDLEIITDNQKRYLIQQFNQLKIRKREPSEFDIPKEITTALHQLIVSYKTKYKADSATLAKKLNLHLLEFIDIYS